MNIFNEAESEASENQPEPVVKKADGFYCKCRKTKREEIIKDLPVREIECFIHEDDCYCPKCSTHTWLRSEEKPFAKNLNIFQHN